MMLDLNEAYISIAQDVYDADIDIDINTKIVPDWIEAICTVSLITKFLEAQTRVIFADGSVRTASITSNVLETSKKIREAMAESHPEGHAWYTMMVKVTATGAYEFSFDYDHLPAFMVIPSPERWVHEFTTYPRPDLQVHVQDWMDGVIKREHSEIIRKRLRALSPIVWIDAVNDD